MSLISEEILPYTQDQQTGSGQPDKTIDLAVTGAKLKYKVGPYSTLCVQGIKQRVWGTAVLTLKRSLDGITGFAMETPTTIGPGDAISPTKDSSGFDWLIVEVTTPEGAAAIASIIVKGKRSTT